MRPAIIVCFLAALLCAPSMVSAQQVGSWIQFHLPQSVPQGTTLVVELDGQSVPLVTMSRPLAVAPGRKVVSTTLLDVEGKPAGDPDEQRFVLPFGVVAPVTIPHPVVAPSTGLIAGGITLTTLGVGSIIASGFLFTLADGAGTDCHKTGFAAPICGQDPAPYLGFGVTTLVFGIAGSIGGPVMIAIGAKSQLSWEAPTFELGPTSAVARWRF